MTSGGPHNLADLVRRAAGRSPDKPALHFDGTTTNWSALDALVDAAAAGLGRLDLSTGDRVGLHLGNTFDFVVGYFGVLRAGLVAVPLNPRYAPAELGHALGDSGARALVTTPESAPSARQVAVAGGPEHLLVTGPADPAGSASWAELLRTGAKDGRVETRGGGEDLAVLLYTSGTSGRPKGAMLPHRALLANLEQTAQIDPPVVSADDVVLLVLPLFHVYALSSGLGAVAAHAATGVLLEQFEPAGSLEAIRRHAVTSIVGAPPMYLAWSRMSATAAAFSSVRLALSGASALPAEVRQRMHDLTGQQIFEGYGLTETAPVLTVTLSGSVPTPDSIGRPIPGVELRLVDRQGRTVEEGDPGEMYVRGANVFLGYWPDATGGPDRDGWFATGDVAYADAAGDLHLVDRRGELVLVSGFSVAPHEVEQVLLLHPGVREAAVLSVPDPDTGQAVRALVVLEPGAEVSAEELHAHCVGSLARFKCPTSVDFVEALPRTATGKVSKGQLRELSA